MSRKKTRKESTRLLSRMVAFALFVFILVSCSYRNPEQLEKEKNEEAIIAFLLTGSTFTATCPTSPTTTTFSELGAMGITSNCATHHSGVSPTAGFDITSYAQTLAKITVNQPSQGVLYQKVLVGSMAQYSNTTINNAILNWICSGGTQ